MKEELVVLLDILVCTRLEDVGLGCGKLFVLTVVDELSHGDCNFIRALDGLSMGVHVRRCQLSGPPAEVCWNSWT